MARDSLFFNLLFQSVSSQRILLICILTSCLDTAVRYCDHCHLLKPDRCHHCSACNKYDFTLFLKSYTCILDCSVTVQHLLFLLSYRCILKMDHHCPWYVNYQLRCEKRNAFLYYTKNIFHFILNKYIYKMCKI